MAAYVWDYAGGMQLISRFWAAAEELDPAVRRDSEGVRFGFCRPRPLRAKAVPATNPDAQPPRASPARPKRPPPDEAPPV